MSDQLLRDELFLSRREADRLRAENERLRKACEATEQELFYMRTGCGKHHPDLSEIICAALAADRSPT